MDKLKDLKSIIYEYDSMIDKWLKGYSAVIVTAHGDDVYVKSDYLRNKALEIINELEENNEDLI